MSILKFVNHNKRMLAEMLAYVMDPQKTSPDLIIGLGVNPPFAFEEMSFANNVWRNQGCVPSYKHIILSFDADVKKQTSLSTIKQISEAVGRLFCTEHQVLAAIHINTLNYHVHYVVQATSLTSGKQYRQSQSLYAYKQAINQILTSYGLEPIHCFTNDSGSPIVASDVNA